MITHSDLYLKGHILIHELFKKDLFHVGQIRAESVKKALIIAEKRLIIG